MKPFPQSMFAKQEKLDKDVLNYITNHEGCSMFELQKRFAKFGPNAIGWATIRLGQRGLIEDVGEPGPGSGSGGFIHFRAVEVVKKITGSGPD